MKSLDEQFSIYRQQNMNLIDCIIYREQKEILDIFPESELAAQIISDLEVLANVSGLQRKLTDIVLQNLLKKSNKNPSIIEVCGGSCWLLRSVISKTNNSNIYSVGSDFSERHIETNKITFNNLNIEWLVADATNLPQSDLIFDISLNCQALHHFPPSVVVKILKELKKVSKKVLVFDLRRTFYGPLLMKLLSPFYSRNFISDGIISHRRAYNIQEMRYIIESSNLPYKISRLTPVGMLLESI
jgi:ubiquinone/menaquinone biosynthesis C-methylase UbiE